MDSGTREAGPLDALRDRFEGCEWLARGGMGDVIAAYDRVHRRRVALKLARSDYEALRFEQCVASLRREAAILSRLAHPSIVVATDFLLLPEGDALVLEYFPGRRWQRDRRHARRTLATAMQVCGALDHLHRRGFVHLDLKAENILVSERDEIRLVDFGIAQRPGPMVPLVDGLSSLVGTPRVMSPEQLDGGHVDERSDLFSLGVLLYEALSGCSPFRDPAGQEVAYVPLADTQWELPIELTMLVDHLLCLDPGARPRSAAEVARRLGRSLAGLGFAPIAPARAS